MSFVPAEIIRKKRDRGSLSDQELSFFIEGLDQGHIQDAQVGAFLMACFLNGLNTDETTTLTRLMKDSGKTMNWRSLDRRLADAVISDKHSSGGIGDKVSLILAPLAAACGLTVPMMSGRGLGHTGGTVDKLESIPGLNMYPSEELMLKSLVENRFVMMAQSDAMCPADKKLYATRDITATVENLSLITASIVSKKWAEGVDSIIYDVKCGEGAFMSTLPQAEALASSLVSTSQNAGLRAKALITRMDNPLGSMVGNAMEVEESLWILQQKFPSPQAQRVARPLQELSLRLTAEMLLIAGISSSLAEATSRAQHALETGLGFEAFARMCHLQGGTLAHISPHARAPIVKEICSPMKGQIGRIKARALGIAGLDIKMGRQLSTDRIDPGVGFELLALEGDKVEKNQPLIRCYLRDASQFEIIEKKVYSIFNFVDDATDPHHLVIKEIA